MKLQNLHRLLIARACSVSSDQLLNFGIPLLVFQIRHSLTDSGIAFFFQSFPRLIALYFSGRLSDRWGAVRVHEWADLTRFSACVISAAVATSATGVFLFWTLSFAGGLIAFCNALAYVGLETATGRFAAQEKMASTQAKFQTIDQLANLGGPLLAAAVAHQFGKTLLLIIAASAFLTSYLFLKTLPAAASDSEKFARIGSWRVLSQVLRIRRVLAFIGLSIAINLGVGIYRSLLPSLITDFYGQDESRLAWISALGGFMGILSLKFVGKFLDSRQSAAGLGLVAFWILIALLMFSSFGPFMLFLVATSLSVLCMAVFNVCQRTTRLQQLPKDQLGRSIGLIILINQLSLPLAGLCVAGLSHLMESQVDIYRWGLFLSALAGLAPSLLFWRGSSENEKSRL